MANTIKLSTLKSNPNNPRIIRDDKFKKLDPSLEIKRNGQPYIPITE